MDPSWLSLIPTALKKALIALGQGLVYVGQLLVSAVKWANAGLPNGKVNGEKELNEHYQNLVRQQQLILTNQSLDLQRQRQRTTDLEEKMDQKITHLEKLVEDCHEDREEQREEIKEQRREIDQLKRLNPNSGATVSGQ